MCTITQKLAVIVVILFPLTGFAGVDDWLREIEKRMETGERMSQQERLNTLKLGLIEAKKQPAVCGNNRCNFFQSFLSETIGVPYIRDVLRYDDAKNEILHRDNIGGVNENRDTVKIHSWLIKAAKSSASGWQSLGTAKNPDKKWNTAAMNEAQRLANQGYYIVISGPQHIAVVVPDSMCKSSAVTGGNGPWIRDAQHPDASVRATKGGNTNEWGLNYGTAYFVWTQDYTNTLHVDPKTQEIVRIPYRVKSPASRNAVKQALTTISKARELSPAFSCPPGRPRLARLSRCLS